MTIIQYYSVNWSTFVYIAGNISISTRIMQIAEIYALVKLVDTFYLQKIAVFANTTLMFLKDFK